MSEELAEQNRITQIALEQYRHNPEDEQAEEGYFRERGRLNRMWLEHTIGPNPKWSSTTPSP